MVKDRVLVCFGQLLKVGKCMPITPLILEDLIAESEELDIALRAKEEEKKKQGKKVSEKDRHKEVNEVLYRFVSASRVGYEIDGCEEEAVCLLVNFSVRRSLVEEPLDRDQAIKHLQNETFKLIRWYKESLRGYHTHNIKFPLSFLQGNIFCELPFDETDPYVHSGSVKLHKRYGYAQNAKYIKAAKALLAEFYYKGKRTSMVEELQQGGHLSQLFLGLLEDSVYRSCESIDQYDEKAECIEDLLDAIDELPEEVFPDAATDPQIFAFTLPGKPELLLSPVVNTGMLNEINLRLADYDWWLGAVMKTGTGNDINTYGSLCSDSGGFLKALCSVPPIEKKGQFRLLADQLSLVGHLYDFANFKPKLLSIGQNYIDDETGQVRRWTRFEQQKALEVESRKIVKKLFRHYEQLRFYLGLGRKLSYRCIQQLETRPAQIYLIEGDARTSLRQKAILEDVTPLLSEQLNRIASENGLSFVEHHQKVIDDAIRKYLLST